MTEASADSIEAAIGFFEGGESQRKFGKTMMNDRSSRSHVIFKIQLEVENLENDEVFSSALNLVDLAGSEGVAKADTEGKRLKEGSSINKSLLAMYNVITKLNSGAGFVSFRESKLTRILQPYLGGNSLTSIICAISPDRTNLQESLNTLRFAMCAGGIKNDVKKNVAVRDRTAELEMLQDALISEQSKRNGLAQQIEMQKEKILELETSCDQTNLDIADADAVNADILKDATELEAEYGLHKAKVGELESENAELQKCTTELEDGLALLENCDTVEMRELRGAIDAEMTAIESKNLRLTERNKILKSRIDDVNSEIQRKDMNMKDVNIMNRALNESTTY